jgi:hypothetical protein
MSRDPRYPDRVPRRYAESPRSARPVRASRQRRYYSRGPHQSTKAVTAKLAALAIVATLLIGGLIAAQMAAGNDPALGPKAVARAKKASARNSGAGSSTSSASSGTDPYTRVYGDDGYYYYYGPSSGYSSQRSSPAPVTSGTS